ncbi:MAG: DUF302 domain-containing protein [Ramlibacter sp.]
MTLFRAFAVSAILTAALACHAADGLVSLKSTRNAKETMDRLEAQVKQRGLMVFARINHSAGAASVGKSLRPTEVLIFGNPQGGTPLMECAQSMGIDLPLKALVWEDASGQVWLGYNDPAYLVKRHDAPGCAAAPNIAKALESISSAVIAP